MTEANATLITDGQVNTPADGTQQTPNADATNQGDGQSQTPEQKAAAEKATADAKAARDAELAKMSPENRAKAEADDKAKADAAAKGKQTAPDKYTDFKLAEGVTLDAEVMTEFGGLAKKHNLTQEAAQEFVDLANKMSLKQGGALATTIEKARTEWGNASKTDKEFGGEQFDANLGVAKKAIDAFATPELKSLLNDSGLGNHPEVIRVFFKIGKAISEDGHVRADKGTVVTGDRSEQIANTLYGGVKAA